jgi:hypothetical protein
MGFFFLLCSFKQNREAREKPRNGGLSLAGSSLPASARSCRGRPMGKEAARLCCGHAWTMARLAVARGPLATHVHGEEASRAAARWHR